MAVSSIKGICLTNSQQYILHQKGEHSVPRLNNSRLIISRRFKESVFRSVDVRAVSTKPEIDFKDPNWKKHIQEDFDRRFNLPHLRDVLDVKPRPNTFSLKSRGPLQDGNGAPHDMRNGYVNDDDRALLKVIKFASPTSAGAECIDPDCSWVEQWVHRAGPRKQIYYEPGEVKAGVVTCGGLCPGLNDVIRQIKKHFKEIGIPADVKYIDPTYMVRACRANASDAILCTVLGQNAVHGAFAGFSGITTGICNTHYVYLPITEVIRAPRRVDPNSRMWHRCLTSNGQPDFY